MSNEPEFTPVNVFSETFLTRMRRRDDAHTASEAEHAGPWAVRDTVGGFGVFRETDSPDAVPQAVFEHREHALLLAAVLPGVGRERLFRIDPEGGPGGYGVQTVWGERWSKTVGRLSRFEPEAAEAMHLGEALVRSPAALAMLLEAAGATALTIAGEILARRL